MIKKYFTNKIIATTFGLFFISLANTVSAQELKCNVSVVANNINSQQSSDKQVFTEMEGLIRDFMNSKRWTNDIYSDEEKIKCNLTITFLRSPQQNVFQGNANFQVLRPVYGTNYETVLLNYVDRNFNVSFNPEERQMVFNEQNFTNNLTAMLGFYSLMALALDYDSFAKLGGNTFLQRAYNLANLASQASVGGWEQTQSDQNLRNKYWLVENLQNQQLLPFREGFYNYHRLVLDNFANDAANGRKQILEFLTNLKTIQTQKSQSVLLSSFFDAKGQEIYNIFSEGTKEEKQKVFDLMKSLDPGKTEIYRKLVK